MGKSTVESEVEKLRKEKVQLMQEVVQLQQEHLMTVGKIDALNQRMQSAELRQKQMVAFLAKVLQNPVFMDHLKQMKEQRAITSARERRRFLRQQQQSSSSESDKHMEQQIVKYKSSFQGSASLLPSIKQGGQEFFRGSDEPENLKGKSSMSSQTDFGFSGKEYAKYLPEKITPEAMVADVIPPSGLSGSRPDFTNFAFKGKGVDFGVDDTAVGIDYLATLNQDIPQESMFGHAIPPAGDCISPEGIWNVGLETGGNLFVSGNDVWENVVYDTREMEGADGSCSLWDLGFHNLDEVLDIDKFVGGESSLQDHKEEAEKLNQACPRDSEP